MEFRIYLGKKVKVEAIDEAEGTPGTSRQFTRFNSECKKKIEDMVKSQKQVPGVTLESILNASDFALEGIINESDNVMKVIIKSIAK